MRRKNRAEAAKDRVDAVKSRIGRANARYARRWTRARAHHRGTCACPCARLLCERSVDTNLERRPLDPILTLPSPW